MIGIDRQCLGYLETTLNHAPCSVIFSRSSQRSPSPGPNHTSSSNASNTAVVPQNSSARPPCSLTPTLAAHFNENLIKHVQGWPADHAEKQVRHSYSRCSACGLLAAQFHFEKIWPGPCGFKQSLTNFSLDCLWSLCKYLIWRNLTAFIYLYYHKKYHHIWQWQNKKAGRL